MATRIDLPAGFTDRHIGPDSDDVKSMLETVGYPTLDALVDDVVPEAIRFRGDLDLANPVPESELISSVLVPAGPDAADDRIVELMAAGDLVVTADIPLADRVVEGGGFALDPRGKLLTEANIKERLAMRDLMDDLRNAGMVTGGPAGFGAKASQEFANQLDRFLTRQLGA